jgi:hypothetical protein
MASYRCMQGLMACHATECQPPLITRARRPSCVAASCSCLLRAWTVLAGAPELSPHTHDLTLYPSLISPPACTNTAGKYTGIRPSRHHTSLLHACLAVGRSSRRPAGLHSIILHRNRQPAIEKWAELLHVAIYKRRSR